MSFRLITFFEPGTQKKYKTLLSLAKIRIIFWPSLVNLFYFIKKCFGPGLKKYSLEPVGPGFRKNCWTGPNGKLMALADLYQVPTLPS